MPSFPRLRAKTTSHLLVTCRSPGRDLGCSDRQNTAESTLISMEATGSVFYAGTWRPIVWHWALGNLTLPCSRGPLPEHLPNARRAWCSGTPSTEFTTVRSTATTYRTGPCSNRSNSLRSTPSRSIFPTPNCCVRSPSIIWRLAAVRLIKPEVRGNLGRGYLRRLCLVGNHRRFVQIQFPGLMGPTTFAYF